MTLNVILSNSDKKGFLYSFDITCPPDRLRDIKRAVNSVVATIYEAAVGLESDLGARVEVPRGDIHNLLVEISYQPTPQGVRATLAFTGVNGERIAREFYETYETGQAEVNPFAYYEGRALHPVIGRWNDGTPLTDGPGGVAHLDAGLRIDGSFRERLAREIEIMTGKPTTVAYSGK